MRRRAGDALSRATGLANHSVPVIQHSCDLHVDQQRRNLGCAVAGECGRCHVGGLLLLSRDRDSGRCCLSPRGDSAEVGAAAKTGLHFDVDLDVFRECQTSVDRRL